MTTDYIKSYTIRILPYEKTIKIQSGKTILDALKSADITIQATCGGEGTCGECLVKVISGQYKKKISAALSEEQDRNGFVLACSTEIIEDMVIHFSPLEELIMNEKIDLFGIDKNMISCSSELKPIIKKFNLNVPVPTLEDNYSDMKRIKRELQKVSGKYFPDAEYSVIKKTAKVLREADSHISIYTLDSEHGKIIDCIPAKEKRGTYGLAIDIGTTTVALCLVDLSSGKILFTKTAFNLQRSCGDEIISRINYSRKRGGLDELNNLILKTIHSLLDDALQTIKIGRDEIYFAAISGNTTMIHLFLNLDPGYIRESPYTPTLNKVPVLKASEIGLNINTEGRIYCAPSIGSYVGGDITSGLISTPLLKTSEKINLFIDIGTNGELVIGNCEWMVTCACSAGPAFEGSGITSGMPASRGAIEKIIIKNNQIEYKVIGDCKPLGICGSGIVDLLSELFINGIIDRSGKFNPSNTSKRLTKKENRYAYLIEEGNNTLEGNDMIITENDITNLIRTKGAIYSSASLLLKNVGLSFNHIDAVYIAGGFGKYLDIENSIRIGLFPDIERSKFHYLGNTSLIGAYLTLINTDNKQLLEEISEKMTYIELNTEPDYMNEYTGSLFLPHTNSSLFPSLNSRTEK